MDYPYATTPSVTTPDNDVFLVATKVSPTLLLFTIGFYKHLRYKVNTIAHVARRAQASSNRINPTAACDSRAPRRETRYNDRGILSCRMRTSASSFRSTSQRTHMRGTMATPMPIWTKRLMLSIVGISTSRRKGVRCFSKS